MGALTDAASHPARGAAAGEAGPDAPGHSCGERPPRADGFDAALAALDEGLALDPRDPGLLLVRSEILAEQGRVARVLGTDPGPRLQGAVLAADAATRSAPGSGAAWERLGWACLNYARELRDARYQVDWAWEKGIAAARRAEALASESSVPPSLLAQMHTDRAETTGIHGGDARGDVAAALAAARRVVEIGDRPIVSRIQLAQAIRQDATTRFSAGEDADARFAEAARVIGEASSLAGGQPGTAGFGVQIAVLWAEAVLLEGRAPDAALEAVAPWAAALGTRTDTDLVAAAQLAELGVVEAQAAVQGGADPGPILARIRPLLERAVAAGVYPALRGRMAEAELDRAAWAARRGEDPRPALAAARRHAERMQSADASLPDGWRLEAEVVLASPAPSAGDLARARAAMDHAVRLTPEDPRLLGLRGLVLAAAGDREGARAALEEAQRRNGRLAAVAALRARLR